MHYAVPDRALPRTATGRCRGRGARGRRKKSRGASAASPQSGGNEREMERETRQRGGRGPEERPPGYGGVRLSGCPAHYHQRVCEGGARAATWVRGGLSAIWCGTSRWLARRAAWASDTRPGAPAPGGGVG